MTDKTLQELNDYVVWTQEVDESGDATLNEFLLDRVKNDRQNEAFVKSLFTDYLIWANGENWEQFLDHCKVGDVPS